MEAKSWNKYVYVPALQVHAYGIHTRMYAHAYYTVVSKLNLLMSVHNNILYTHASVYCYVHMYIRIRTYCDTCIHYNNVHIYTNTNCVV